MARYLQLRSTKARLACNKKGQAMLEMDLERPDVLVEQSIVTRCSRHGLVASIELHRDPSPFALVKMVRPEQTKGVASEYQGSIFGSAALIRLKHAGE